MKILKKVFLSILIIFVLLLIGLTVFVATYNPKSMNIKNSQLIVILGAGYQLDVTPVPALEKRLQKGLEIWKQLKVTNQEVFILLSGRDREVFVMQEYLREEGVASRFILKDLNGQNTRKTILNTYRIQKLYHSNPIFISQAYHLPRIYLYTWYYNIDAQFIASDRLPLGFKSMIWPALREALAIILFLGFYVFILHI
ncbi:MAG: YdcF family protein [Brevinema sp.]